MHTSENDTREEREDERLSLKLFVVLTKAYKSIADRAVRDIKKYGLSISEFGILEVLYAKGEIPMQQVGGKVLVTSGTMTYNIDKLAYKGLVRRMPCAEDRRIVNAALTDAGRELLGRIFPHHSAQLTHMMQGLTAPQKQQAIELLKLLGKGANKP